MKRLIYAVVGLAAIISCSRQEITSTYPETGESSSVIATATDFESGDNTKTNITQSGSNPPAFAWKEGDVIGVIPMNNETVQSNYKVGEIGSDPKKALFDGGVWALKEGKSYAAYYPFQNEAVFSGENLIFSFLGQTQSANNSLAHIGDYDYMYASAVIPQSGNAQFNFSHLISLVRIQITVPAAGTYSKVVFQSTSDWFANTAEMKLSDGTMTAKETAKKVTINLDDIEVPANGVLTVWFAMLPTSALSGRNMSVILYGNGNTVVGDLTGFKTISAGKAYSYSCKPSEYHPEYVDLGLSVKWATCNINAFMPEEYGDYYAWGEIEPKPEYSWSTYKWCSGSETTITKYCMDSNYGNVDNKTVLDPEDDIAHVQFGDYWRIPTASEWQELMDEDNCSWEWTTQNGVNGYKVTSKKAGYTDKYVFLPEAGNYYSQRFGPIGGHYWTSSLYPDSSNWAYYVYYSSGGSFQLGKTSGRFYGLSVRPVYDNSIHVSSISLNKASTSLNAGAEYQLSCTINPSNATNKSVNWSSSNTSVATVDSTGNITAVAAGTATITVKTSDGSKTATCTVTVTQPVTGVSLSKSSLSLNVGSTSTLTATVSPSTATNKNVTWSSSNTSVATVSNGTVTAVAAGTATITVKTSDGSKTATCTVTVTQPVTGVSLSKSSLSLSVGGTSTLTATVSPSTATNKNVIWSSSNTSVATVSNGTVTAVAAGTATITVKTSDGSKTATCTVTVTQPVTGVSLSKTSLSLAVGGTSTLTATVSPSTATNKNVTWSSSNTSVATVSNGTVTAVAAGTATITVKTSDGSKTATCTVTVTQPVTGVSLSKTSLSLAVGGTSTLTATVSPSTATNKNVTWSSSNTSVATVSNGTVTAVAAGTATITVKTSDGSKTATCTVTVTQPVTGVSLSKSSLSLSVGGTSTLTATVSPSTATNKNVTWSSSNTSVATVSNGTVTAVAAGTATITVKTSDGSKTATCTVTVKVPTSGIESGYEWVDLGLSVKWATFNVGASKPEEYGGYYQWGGLEDVSSTSIDLYWDNCPYHTGSSYNSGWSKYNTNSSYGTVDNKYVLDSEDDIAHVKWGGNWRMPTDAEFAELRNTDNCTWEWTTLNGVKGYMIISKKEGYNDKWLFLPAAGSRDFTYLSFVGSSGYYWSSSLYASSPDYAYNLSFDSSSVRRDYGSRCGGLSVRPVTE